MRKWHGHYVWISLFFFFWEKLCVDFWTVVSFVLWSSSICLGLLAQVPTGVRFYDMGPRRWAECFRWPRGRRQRERRTARPRRCRLSRPTAPPPVLRRSPLRAARRSVPAARHWLPERGEPARRDPLRPPAPSSRLPVRRPPGAWSLAAVAQAHQGRQRRRGQGGRAGAWGRTLWRIDDGNTSPVSNPLFPFRHYHF